MCVFAAPFYSSLRRRGKHLARAPEITPRDLKPRSSRSKANSKDFSRQIATRSLRVAAISGTMTLANVCNYKYQKKPGSKVGLKELWMMLHQFCVFFCRSKLLLIIEGTHSAWKWAEVYGASSDDSFTWSGSTASFNEHCCQILLNVDRHPAREFQIVYFYSKLSRPHSIRGYCWLQSLITRTSEYLSELTRFYLKFEAKILQVPFEFTWLLKFTNRHMANQFKTKYFTFSV